MKKKLCPSDRLGLQSCPNPCPNPCPHETIAGPLACQVCSGCMDGMPFFSLRDTLEAHETGKPYVDKGKHEKHSHNPFRGEKMEHAEKLKNHFTLSLDCIPTPQARARHSRLRNGRSIAYKSDAQIIRENALALALMPYRSLFPEPLKGAVGLDFVAVMPIPASASKVQKEKMALGQIHHTKKPDLDNLAKQLKDAITRMRFWEDDRQVIRINAKKIYGTNPHWTVNIWEM